MTRTMIGKVMWIGRATVFTIGLAVTLALMLGVATAALAAVPGDPFRLGQLNAVNTLTRLAGSTNNAMLRINNASAGPNATALDLQVAPGRPPMTVNSAIEVQGLNVDSLDGKNSNDFLQECIQIGMTSCPRGLRRGRLRIGPVHGELPRPGIVSCDPATSPDGGGADLPDEVTGRS